MHAVVTGAAGFIGSHLCAELLRAGDSVLGVDTFTPYYDRALKERNVESVPVSSRMELVEADLNTAPLDVLLDGADVVYHLAGQPGVRPSWGEDFPVYVRQNVLATQRLLEACRTRPLHKLVYASSSSVYGDAESYPTSETLCPRPVSPYGVTKLAGEHLCELYRTVFGVPTCSLRLFTVYGPRQRPDMAFSRLVSAALAGEGFLVFGDGTQTRDFTYVGDVVRAMRQAARSEWTGVANIGGGARTSMNTVLEIVGELCRPVPVQRVPRQDGDVLDTAADTTAAHEGFGYEARTSLRDGLRQMVLAARVPERVLVP